jgi:hypothetical protein
MLGWDLGPADNFPASCRPTDYQDLDESNRWAKPITNESPIEHMHSRPATRVELEFALERKFKNMRRGSFCAITP